jgi:hypothetical protein
MTEYRCCGLDADNNVKVTEMTRYEGDDVARLRAAIILANYEYPIVEAWDGERLVCRLSKQGRHHEVA